MRRFTRTTRLIAALLALVMAVPTAALASSPCCCVESALESREAHDQTTAADLPSCCATRGTCETDQPERSTPDDDTSPCNHCDCPGACCLFAKAPVGTSESDEPALPASNDEQHDRPVADRFDGDGAMLDLITPPRA